MKLFCPYKYINLIIKIQYNNQRVTLKIAISFNIDMYHFSRVSSSILTLDQKLNELWVPYHDVCAKMKNQL